MKHDIVKSIEIAKRIIDDERKNEIYANQVVDDMFEELVETQSLTELRRKLLVKKEEADDITRPPNERRANKAWVTMFTRKLNGIIQPTQAKKSEVSTYNRPRKNAFRDVVISYAKSVVYNASDYILALESSELLFVKKLPRSRFIIYESNLDVFESIRDAKCKNITYLRFGDISNVGRLFDKYEHICCRFAFLDFCNTLESNISKLKVLSEYLIDCEYIALTFCLRGKNKTEINLYSVSLVKTLQDIFTSYKIEYFTSYKDGAPMAGIILKRYD